MKKIALAFGFLLALQGMSSAQKDFRLGIQASPTLSWLRTDDKLLEGAGSNIGLKFGVLAESYFADNYAFMLGLGFGFNHGGTLLSKYDSIAPWPNADLAVNGSFPLDARFRYSLTYVEIPFGLRFRGGTNEDSRLKFYAEAPVFTLGFRTKASGDVRGNVPDPTEDENIKKDVNSLSLSWGVGAGIEYELAANANLVAGLAFQQQFTDMTQDDGQVLPRNSTWKQDKSKGAFNAISLRLAFFF